MAWSWSPRSTEAKARKVLQDAQQPAESEEMKSMRGEDPKEDLTELPGAAARQILRSQQAPAGRGSFLQRPTLEKDCAT